MMIKAVIFDLDDTFSLTETVCFDIENTVLKQMGRPPISRHAHRQTWEQRFTDAITLRSPGIDTSAFMARYEPLLAEYRATGKFDDIPETNYQALDELAARGKKLMILSSRVHSHVQHLLQPEHPLASRIEKFQYRENTRYRKPNPKVFDEIITETGLRPEECVYVGDSRYDAAAAKQAGLYFIANLESGLRDRGYFTNLDVDGFINTFPEVVAAVQRLDKTA